ncbi:MAG: hypothetical protein U0Q16_17345 [Bryobacteraceae bacterium]
MAQKQIILLEFNELCPPLLDRWMAQGELPNFRRFYDDSAVFTALADELNPDYLDPWIQWYSLHTGLAYKQHRVLHLTDGPKAGHNDIWKMLMSGGHTVANCGSMNAASFRCGGGFYIPDPWCNTESPNPDELGIYHKVVTNRVQENSTGGEGCLTRNDYKAFLRFLMRHGLTGNTVFALASQLFSDTIMHAENKWKRAALLDLIQTDVFLHFWNRARPEFSTFFLNSTAHFQHAYWHCAFPEEFDGPRDEAYIEAHKGAVLHGYRQMDALLERFFDLEKQGVTLILSTALSQQANVGTSDQFYRVREIRPFLQSLGIEPVEVLPVMTEQYSAQFRDEASARAAREKLAELRVEGIRIIDFGKAPEGSLYFGCGIRSAVGKESTIEGLAGSPRFFDVFYTIPHTKSARHHPDSVLWFKTGKHQVHRKKVSILDIVPTLLDMYGVDRRKADPKGELQGTSLKPVIEGAAAEVHELALVG